MRWLSKPAVTKAIALGTTLFDIGNKFYSYGLMVLGPLLVLTANLLILGVAWVLLTTARPFLPLYLQIPLTAMGFWFLFNILFNYWCCILTSPGHPDADVRGCCN
jgi:hypothetical protein